MPVKYSEKLVRFLLHWKGSLWKLVWQDCLAFLVLYTLISTLYRFVFDYNQRVVFEDIVFNVYPVVDTVAKATAYLLGFFVVTTLHRWWTQFELLPWPEELMMTVSFAFPEPHHDEHVIRAAAARYFCLTTLLAGRRLSSKLMQKYPTMESVRNLGLITEEEIPMHNRLPAEVQATIPMVWLQQMIHKEAKKRNIDACHSEEVETLICACITQFRELFGYNWVNIPLAYSQIVACAAYTYFVVACLGKQFILSEDRDLGEAEVDYYIPIFVLMQLIFFMSWYRVGMKLLKPFGDDDEDFDIADLLSRHIEVAFEMADLPMHPLPELKHMFGNQRLVNQRNVGFMPVVVSREKLKRKMHKIRKKMKTHELARPQTAM